MNTVTMRSVLMGARRGNGRGSWGKGMENMVEMLHMLEGVDAFE